VTSGYWKELSLLAQLGKSLPFYKRQMTNLSCHLLKMPGKNIDNGVSFIIRSMYLRSLPIIFKLCHKRSVSGDAVDLFKGSGWGAERRM
jgi:hypothetical protein